MAHEAPRGGSESPAGTEQITTVVDASGRLVVPAPFRHALGFRDRQRVVVSLNGKALWIQTAEDARKANIQRARVLAKRYGAPAGGAVAALIAERRRESRVEDDAARCP